MTAKEAINILYTEATQENQTYSLDEVNQAKQKLEEIIMKFKKVFISQPMANKTNEEIKAERKQIDKAIEEKYGEGNYEIVDSFFENAPHDAKPLWFLGKSFELLSTADVCVFAKGWEDARGCGMEHAACVNYGIKVWYF